MPKKKHDVMSHASYGPAQHAAGLRRLSSSEQRENANYFSEHFRTVGQGRFPHASLAVVDTEYPYTPRKPFELVADIRSGHRICLLSKAYNLPVAARRFD